MQDFKAVFVVSYNAYQGTVHGNIWPLLIKMHNLEDGNECIMHLHIASSIKSWDGML